MFYLACPAVAPATRLNRGASARYDRSMPTAKTYLIAVVGLALAAAACTASFGTSTSEPAPSAPQAEAPPAAGPEVTPELTEARAKVVALINASVVLRCDAGEAKTAEDEAACATARASMTVAAPAAQGESK